MVSPLALFLFGCRSRSPPALIDRLDDEQLAELVWTFIGLVTAGHSTTTALLGNGIWHLLSDPGQWELLCQRPDLIGNAVYSFFRVSTPSWATVGG